MNDRSNTGQTTARNSHQWRSLGNSATSTSGGRCSTFRTTVNSGMAKCLLILSMLALFSSPTQACCTNTTCPYYNSPDNTCRTTNAEPVCNTFGCNCAPACGTMTLNWVAKCVWDEGCGDATAQIAGAKARFAEVDTGDDGKISVEELLAWHEKNVVHPVLSATASDAERKEYLRKNFDEMDIDRNKFITPNELDTSLADESGQ